ncbi:MAG: hypothetical protein OEW00_14525 [candidate division Zixibacteria bacterium]|nr:hypothetical protein [candidate division Zixibacteria bacterium]
MKKSFTLLGLLVVFSSGNVHAANIAVIASPPNLLNLAVLLIAVFGIVASFKVLALVRGGVFSRSWQLFVAAFGVLALAQLAFLINTIEMLLLPTVVVPALVVVATGLFLYGIWEAKRVLG